MSNNKSTIKPKVTKKSQKSFVCDCCGKEETGVKHQMYDENWNKMKGIFMCNGCHEARAGNETLDSELIPEEINSMVNEIVEKSNADKKEFQKLKVENERLKKEVAEWELFSKAANESIEERNKTIAQLRKTALKALETIKVAAEANEEVKGYELSHIIELCDKFKKEIKGE